jgi:hypothetical protein
LAEIESFPLYRFGARHFTLPFFLSRLGQPRRLPLGGLSEADGFAGVTLTGASFTKAGFGEGSGADAGALRGDVLLAGFSHIDTSGRPACSWKAPWPPTARFRTAPGLAIVALTIADSLVSFA